MENTVLPEIILEKRTVEKEEVVLDFEAVKKFLMESGEDSEELDKAHKDGRDDLIYDALLHVCKDDHDILYDEIDQHNLMVRSTLTRYEIEFNC